MGGQDLAAEESRDPAPPIQGDVDAEVYRQERPVGADLLLSGVPFQQSPGAASIADDGCTVVMHDGIDVSQRGKDPFVSTREAGHEMRLDEAEDEPAIGLDVLAVEIDR